MLAAGVQEGLAEAGSSWEAGEEENEDLVGGAGVRAHAASAAAIVEEARERLQAAVARGVRIMRGSPSVVELSAELEAWLLEGGRLQTRLEDALQESVGAVEASAVREEAARAEGRACRRAFELHLTQSSRETREAARRGLEAVRELEAARHEWALEREAARNETEHELRAHDESAAAARSEVEQLSALHAQQLGEARMASRDSEHHLAERLRLEEASRLQHARAGMYGGRPRAKLSPTAQLPNCRGSGRPVTAGRPVRPWTAWRSALAR